MSEFLDKLNQKYGTPKEVGIDTFKNITKDKNLFEQAGMAVCATKYPQIPAYAGLAGAGAGILVTLLVVFIYNTFFRRRKPQVIVMNNSSVPATVSVTTTPDSSTDAKL
jgi:hypothetical protein